MFLLFALACHPAARQLDELTQDHAALRSRHAAAVSLQRDEQALARLYLESEWDHSREMPADVRADRDTARRGRARALLDAGGARGLEAQLYAAALLSRGGDAAELERAWRLATEAVHAGLAAASPVATRARDAWDIAEGRPQSFGTQTLTLDGAVMLYAVSGEVDDAERARWGAPPLETTVAEVLAANGLEGPPTLEHLAERGLLAQPEGPLSPARLRGPLPRCAGFEGMDVRAMVTVPDRGAERERIGLGGAWAAAPHLSGTVTIAGAGADGGHYAAEGIWLEGPWRAAHDVGGDAPAGRVALAMPPGEALTLRFDPAVERFSLRAIGVAGVLSIEAWSGEDPLYPDSAQIIRLPSEGAEAGGLPVMTGLPRPADRLVLRSPDDADAWGVDDLCVGP